jgi:hypothetical protein
MRTGMINDRALRSARVLKAVALACAATSVAPLTYGFDANGVGLGGRETEVKKAFPSVRCKALEWRSEAADRRCDDAEVAVGGIPVRITFYLKRDMVQGFDLRFDTRDVERMAVFLKGRYGAPQAEARETIQRKGDAPREVYRVRWQKGMDHAVLAAQLEKKRSSVLVARGDFEEEIYRVR